MKKLKHPQFQKNVEIQKLKQKIEQDDTRYYILQSRNEQLEKRLNLLYDSLISLIFDDNNEIYQELLTELKQTQMSRIVEFRNKIKKDLTSDDFCGKI